MGLYRATLNQSEARVGQTVLLDDFDSDIRKRVLYGHLVPVDEVARNAQTQVVVVDVEEVKSQKDRIKEALEAAKAAKVSASSAPEESSVQTAITREPEPVVEAPSEGVPTAEAPARPTRNKRKG